MSGSINAGVVAAAFHVTPSARYRRFLTKREWIKVNGWYAVLPHYAVPLKVRFDGALLESFFRDRDEDDSHEAGDEKAATHPATTEAELGGTAGWVPLATLGEEEPTFLAVRGGDEACPVAIWEPERKRFLPVIDSLDAWLKSLAPTPAGAEAPRDERDLPGLVDAVNRVDAALGGRRSKAQRAKLEAALEVLQQATAPERMPSEKALAGGEYHGLPSRALYTIAKALEALGRFDEACDVLEHSFLDGVRVSIAPETSCRILLHKLDRPDRVIDVCSAMEGEMSPLQRGLFALALFRRGDISAAAKHFHAIVDRQVEATLKLSPKAERPTEVAKRWTAVRASIHEYAEHHGLAQAEGELLAALEAS